MHENRDRASYDGAKRGKGSKVHVAINTLSHLLVALVTPADAPERGQVAAFCERGQQVTGQTAQVAYIN